MSKWNLVAMGQAGLTGWRRAAAGMVEAGAVSGCGNALWLPGACGADEQRGSPGR